MKFSLKSKGENSQAFYNLLSTVVRTGVNFLTQKMFVEAPEERFDEIMKEVVKVCKKVEPDCVILL